MGLHFFTEQQKEEIIAAIRSAEKNTSGEVQVHIEAHCGKNTTAVDRAVVVFKKLNMNRTKARNGVLFYLAYKDQQFAILGDEGIDAKVPANFWSAIKDHMQQCFRQGDFTKGLTEGILQAGEALKKHFPYASDDINELPDEISFGSNE